MGATPSQHLGNGEATAVQWPIQDDMGVVIALPAPPPLKQTTGSLLPRSPKDYLGRRVLGVHANSPAASCGLVPWLDYVVGINNRFYVEEDADSSFTKGFEPQKRAKLHVFNIKSQSIRECSLQPTLRDGQMFIGVKISALHMPDVDGIDKTVHVVAVLEGSPAQHAGLEGELDYLLGSPEFGAFATLDDVEYAIMSKEEKALEVYVYNKQRDDVRLVQVRPHLGWSEDGGLLGAELANGIIHRIPASCRRTCGRDMFTASEIRTVAKEQVRTPDGIGELVDVLKDGSSLVRLEWGLGPEVNVMGKYLAKHVEPTGGAS